MDGARPVRELHMVRTDEVAPQIRDGGQQPLVVAGNDPVVAVEKGEVLAARRIDSRVACGGQAPVLLVSDQDGTGDLALGALEDLQSSVGRTVVDEDEFEIISGIGPQTSQGIGGICLHVVERHDDGELNHASHARRRPVICLGPGRDGR